MPQTDGNTEKSHLKLSEVHPQPVEGGDIRPARRARYWPSEAISTAQHDAVTGIAAQVSSAKTEARDQARGSGRSPDLDEGRIPFLWHRQWGGSAATTIL
jgi:hypothetical protein